MSIPFKKIRLKNPRDLQAAGKFYPRLITMGQTSTLELIAYKMEKMSSLSIGDIKSVLANFVEAMRAELYNGHSVNIQDFGVFNLRAHTTGEDKKEDCGVKNIKSVKISFLPSTSVKPDLSATRAGERLDFFDAETAVIGTMGVVVPPVGGGGEDPGGGGAGGGGEIVDPIV